MAGGARRDTGNYSLVNTTRLSRGACGNRPIYERKYLLLTVFKYPIPMGLNPENPKGAFYGQFKLDLPSGAKPLSVGIQNGGLVLWVQVVVPDRHENDFPTEPRHFLLLGTGKRVNSSVADDDIRFVGTVQQDWFVGHLFEVLR